MANYGKQFEGVEGPSDAELKALEDHHEIYGDDFSPETVKGLQSMYAKIDPGYARLVATRERKNVGARRAGFDISRPDMSSVSSQEERQLVPGTDSSNAPTTDFDPSDSIRAVGGAPIDSGRSYYYDENKNNPNYQVGLHLLRTAGNCNHPRCQSLRGRGMELIGAVGRFGVGEEYWKASQPEIPSVATLKKSNSGNYIAYRPADPQGSEWQSALASTKNDAEALYRPEHLLQHHHPEGDMDFEKYPAF